MTTARTTAGPLAAGALRRALLLALAALTAILALGSASASAAEPQIRVSMLKPDNVTPGKYLGMWVNVISEGDAPLSGNLTIKYTFPTGVSVRDPEADGSPAPTCSQVGQVDECVIDATGIPLGRTLTYKTVTEVDSGASGTLNGQIEVSGGGLASPTVVRSPSTPTRSGPSTSRASMSPSPTTPTSSRPRPPALPTR
jgi:hypothetical protein